MNRHLSTARLLVDHLRSGFRASLLVAFLITITVFVVALVPRAFAEVATAELRYQLEQEFPEDLDLSGEGRIGLPPPPNTGVQSVDDLLGRTDDAIRALTSTLPEPLADGAGTPVWLTKSATWPGSIDGVDNLVLALRLAVDLEWTERIDYIAGEEPRPWSFDESAGPDDNPVEIALSEKTAEAMELTVGDTIQYTTGPLRVAGIYEPRDPDDSYWSHAFDLERPAVIRETGMPPRILSTAFIAPGTLVPLQELFSGALLTAWIPVDPQAYSFADAAELASQIRNLTATPVALPDFGALSLGSSFTDVIDSTEIAVAAITALIALSASGLLGVLLATYALSIQALIRRRRPALALASARGATPGQLRGVMVLEAAIVALPGSALAIAAAALVVKERVGIAGWLAPTVLAIIPLLLAAVLVAPRGLREQRQDISVRSRSSIRWVLEAAVAGAAVIALVLLQRRGLLASADVVGVDPLLVATPVLLAAAVGLLALRLFPLPLRAVRSLVRRRAAPVAEVGSARAIREPAMGPIAALALVVGMSIVVFSTILVSTIGVTMERAAEETVGADALVMAHDLPEVLVDEIRDVPGVTAAVAMTYRANVPLNDEAGRINIGVVLVDPAEFAAVRPDLPALDEVTGGEYPVLVSQTLSERLLGTGIRLVDAPIEPSAVVADSALPGLTENWVVIQESAAESIGLGGQVPSRVLVNLVEDYEPATVDAIRALVLAAQPEQFVGSASVTDVRSVLGERREAPITAGLEGSLIIATLATLVLTMLVVALAATASAASRNRVVGVLRIIGMTPRQVRALVAWEFGPVAISSLLVGTALGIGLPYLVTAVLDLRGFFGGTSLPTPSLEPGWIAVAVAVYAATVVLAVIVAAALGRRFAPAATLKMGES